MPQYFSSHAGKMMKKIAIAGALLALTGCVQVDNYQDVIKHPVPAHLAGYWQSKGPQSKMVSPEAIATLVVTEEGDTLDCRQWQRVLAVPGKIMLRSDSYYNVTASWISIRWSAMVDA
jgi:DNA-binding transcriptional regulator of glucitol operon